MNRDASIFKQSKANSSLQFKTQNNNPGIWDCFPLNYPVKETKITNKSVFTQELHLLLGVLCAAEIKT